MRVQGISASIRLASLSFILDATAYAALRKLGISVDAGIVALLGIWTIITPYTWEWYVAKKSVDELANLHIGPCAFIPDILESSQVLLEVNLVDADPSDQASLIVREV